MSFRLESTTKGFETVPHQGAFHTFTALGVTTGTLLVSGQSGKRICITNLSIGPPDTLTPTLVTKFFDNTTSTEVFRLRNLQQDTLGHAFVTPLVLPTANSLLVSPNTTTCITVTGYRE